MISPVDVAGGNRGIEPHDTVVRDRRYHTTKGDPVGFDINDYVGSDTAWAWDGGRCVIRNPRFTRIPEYRNGQQVLLLVDVADLDEGIQMIDRRIGLGNGWIANDDETEIVGHEADSNRKLKFNNKTFAGRLLKTMPEEMVAALGERWKQGDEVTPFKVGFWDGLQVTLDPASEEFTTDSGETANQKWYEFVSFEGYEGAGGSGKKPAAKKAPAKKAAKKAAAKKSEPEPADDSSTDTDIDPKVVEAIVAQAWEADDFDEFVANCYANVDEVAESETYQAMVEDDSEDSIWGKVCAEAE